MKSINEYIDDRLIISDISAETKEEALRALVDRIFEVRPEIFSGDFAASDLYGQVLERENIQTTGMGNGIAFPHARIADFNDFVLAIGISKNGIDWKSRDDKPCHRICLMFSPILKPYLILQMMSVLASFMCEPENINRLTCDLSSKQIAELIKESTLVTTKMVLARDIMHPVLKTVQLETSIEEATHMMHLNRLDILPVIDDTDTLLGEISCMDIFKYGIPDFFSQLQTISFMRNLDPFEKYFKLKKDLKVRDIYSPDVNVIPKEATLMEMIFEMTTKNKLKLFVVDSDKLIGAVDRYSIIDKILFF